MKLFIKLYNLIFKVIPQFKVSQHYIKFDKKKIIYYIDEYNFQLTELAENNNTTKQKRHGRSHLFHFGDHQKKNLRSSRTSVGAVFSEKDKNSNRHLEEMVQARMESLGLANKSRPCKFLFIDQGYYTHQFQVFQFCQKNTVFARVA